jgi:hypothetical protein
MQLPIPKSMGDKILTALGLVVTISSLLSAFLAGQGYVGVAGTLTGVGMTAKGMEEFIGGGNLQQAVEDIINGIEAAKNATPAAVKEAEATTPTQAEATAVAAIPVVEQAAQDTKEAEASSS